MTHTQRAALMLLSVLLSAGCISTHREPVVSVMDAWEDGSTALFSGLFFDEAGHHGPLECKLTRVNSDEWHASFSAANEGEGPNAPFTREATFAGLERGKDVFIFGEVPMNAGGPYVVRAILSHDKLTSNYERKAGGWAGTFELKRSSSVARDLTPQ